MKEIKFKLVREGGAGRDGITKVTHISFYEDGKFLKFEPHDEALLDFINNNKFIVQ